MCNLCILTYMKDPKQSKNSMIKSVSFVKGIIGTDTIIDSPLPMVAFVGRSNVGKSSTINKLLGKQVARPSGTPGKTQEINFFRVNEALFFVDLPGYGYAKTSVAFAEKLRKRILWFLSEAKLFQLVLIIDPKAGITKLDEDLLEIVKGEDIPLVVVVNKIDKLNQKEKSAALKNIYVRLGNVGFENAQVFSFSARTGQGREKILEFLILNS
jgi:GTP-binding protein